MDNPELKRFGRYEIVAELGRGAMGVVYKARDPQIERFVAVKTVSLWGQEKEEEKEFRLRFMNEAQAAGRLHHPGIVGVFDMGEQPENQDPYIVLEYVPGESLNRILARERKIELSRALKLAQEIAEALDFAHGQGVVHRDIKPANILITEDGHAKIADFGIAKLNLAHFTVPGRVLGTPAYMAPEQLSGEGADGRSDLFSLGVILYVMVTGLSPFQGDSATTVCFKVVNREPVAPSALDLDLPPLLDAVVSRAIAKNPNERYQRGSEFAEDLALLQQNYRPGSTTTSLQAIPGFSIRHLGAGTKTSNSAIRPLTAMSQAHSLADRIRHKAPIGNLVLGAAAVLLLIIIGAQSRMMVIAPKAEPNPASLVSDGSSSSPGASPMASNAPTSNSSAPASTVPSTPPHAGSKSNRKTAPSNSRKPALPVVAREIVVPTSTLELSVQHQFKDATLYIFVDDKLVLTRALHGGTQKKLVVFSGVRGVESETLQIPAGRHAVRVRALSTDQTIDVSRTVSAEFVGGDQKSLQVILDKHNTEMRLNWQ